MWVGNQGSSTPSLVVSGVNGNGNVGIGTVGAPTAALHVNLGGSSGVGLKITGASSGGTTDNVNGVVIGLDYNTSGNRQFSLADSETGIGSRFLTSGGLPNIDGYNRSTAARTNLQLGTDTTDIYVMRNLFVANRMTTVHASTTGSLSVASGVQLATASGRVGIGTTSPASLFQVSAGASATTTVDFGAQSTSAKTCFNVRNNTGAATSFYFVGTSMVVEAGRCK